MGSIAGGSTVAANLSVSDIEIGAVEIKDATTDTRAVVDSIGNVMVAQGKNIAGEDLANNVLMVEQRFSPLNCTADTLVKTGAGMLHSLTFSCGDAEPTAGSIIVYDNTAESGTILYSETFDTEDFRGFTVIIDGIFGTGLYVGFTTSADINCVASFR